VILSVGEPVPATESGHQGSEFLGKLDGGGGRNVLQTAQHMGSVQKQVAEEVAKSNLQPAEDLRDIELFPKG
jgi:hypothetical protein